MPNLQPCVVQEQEVGEAVRVGIITSSQRRNRPQDMPILGRLNMDHGWRRATETWNALEKMFFDEFGQLVRVVSRLPCPTMFGAKEQR